MSELAIRRNRLGRKSSEPELIRRHRPDYLMLIFMVVLMALSLIVMYSIWPALVNTYGDRFIGKQLLYLGLGLGAFLIMARVPLKTLERYATWFLVTAVGASLLLSLLSLVPSTPLVACINGACSWFDFGFTTFQPVEYVKFALVVYVGVFLAARMRDGTLNDPARTLLPLGIVAGLIMLLIVVFQTDFGSGFILLAMLAAMAFVAGVHWKYLLGAAGGLGVLGIITILLQPHRMERIAVYFGASGAGDAASYHSQQALIAIGSGGFFGKGLAGGVQAYGYLPEAINDSIFAVVAEMFGFVGTLAVLLIFGGLIYRLIVLIQRSQRPEFKLMAAGVAAWIAVHTFVNIGSMLGIIPITGITLPFLSYGGSSLVLTMAAMGVAFSMSRYTSHGKLEGKNEKETANSYENSLRGRRVRGARSPRAGRYQRA